MIARVAKAGILAAFLAALAQPVQALDVIPDEAFELASQTNTYQLYLTEPQVPEVWTEEEKLCLALNLWHEARHEPIEGLVAVAQVTLNRVEHPDFPDSVCTVVYERTKNKQQKIICQFTWTCQQLRQPKPSEPTWLAVLDVVNRLIQGEFLDWQQRYKNSLNYHAYYVNPKWNLKPLKRIGAHIFYQRF